MSDHPDDAVMALEPTSAPPSRGELEDGLRLVFHNLIESRLVQADVAATLKALVETLVASGALPHGEYERRRQRELDSHVERLHERPVVQLARAQDKYALEDLPKIDCASIIPICQARCCKLTVCLSAQDLDERVITWDYGKPYQIRKRDSDGYCNHSEPETRRCGVYPHRPGICRSYDCRNDKRIWADFERRILQQE
ncbi:MAG TPA: YkgJ family cysteine cluster protein [Polyangia bacterium]|nr:YkgJ family cysteine cluster protein [Polyangia bacterium]